MAREVDYEALSAGSQFKAQMDSQNDPSSIMLGVNIEYQAVLMSQFSGRERIAMGSPEVMRMIGKALIETAAKWERGEIPGLKVPE